MESREMANSTKQCKQCKKWRPAENLVKHPIGVFCDDNDKKCIIEFTQKASNRARAKQQAKWQREQKATVKADRVQHAADKARIRKRTGKGGYYDSLKIALHYYVKHVLRKGEPCYTCGKPQRFEDTGGAFHVGHYMPAGTVDPRRFMIENLRMQCFSCNAAKSGNQAVYRKKLTEEMGAEHVEWLECVINHKSLNEQYPTFDAILSAARHYRKLSK
jgi:hypothetical protein